jgi:RecB family endonuclease NucS
MENGHEIRHVDVRGLYRSGSLNKAARELEEYKGLVGVQEVRWDKRGAEQAEYYTFFLCKRN